MSDSTSVSRMLGVLDTAVETLNYGDHIIVDASRRVIDEVFPGHHQLSVPTHGRIGWYGLRLLRQCEFSIACGSNLLHAHMGLIQQWRIGPVAGLMLKPVVLLGVGWRSHPSRKTDWYTRTLLKKVLSRDYLHSVRDSYSEERIREAGFENVTNTGCPTLWGLTPQHCVAIPTHKAEDVVLVLTDYSRNKQHDRQLIESVRREYRKIFFWPQGLDDIRYLRSFEGTEDFYILPRNLRGYDAILSDASVSLDYVGTRLHGGIRALQHGRRALIIGVDHRAMRMGADFNLPVVDRYVDPDVIDHWINGNRATEIALPVDKIEQWKNQFRKDVV